MAGKVFYNKLIRDKIPEVIRNAGSECEVRELGNEEYQRELLKKVEEEASGVASAASREEIVRELADVLDVIREVKLFTGITDAEIRLEEEKAYEKKGGFEKRLFLVWSSDDGYKTNEKKND